MVNKGVLYLIPTFLTDSSDETSISTKNADIIHSLTHFIVEREKTARAFLKKVKTPLPQSSFTMFELNEHTHETDLISFIQPLINGHNMGLLSEAGMPCLADPGAKIVTIAHRAGIRVRPLSGPSSILQALVGSGMNGQNFAFKGYLPVDKPGRINMIKQLERNSRELNQTQIFIETPYRNNSLVEDLFKNCRPETLICIASAIDDPEKEDIRTLPVSRWKNEKIDLQKIPTVFLIHAQ